MSAKALATAKAPAAIEPYSLGIAWDRLVVASGQLPIDPETSAMPDSVATFPARNPQRQFSGECLKLASLPRRGCVKEPVHLGCPLVLEERVTGSYRKNASGKAMAGIIDPIRTGAFKPGANVVFQHSGSSALYEYAEIFIE